MGSKVTDVGVRAGQKNPGGMCGGRSDAPDPAGMSKGCDTVRGGDGGDQDLNRPISTVAVRQARTMAQSRSRARLGDRRQVWR
jgi:hypothetical protein